ncbi:MAG TPA: EamA family transporter [Candidatus Micrarchaeaceae archaeon]|nr:EamA family transporter [Candidatus Micrarchaeaceae archaeon]
MRSLRNAPEGVLSRRGWALFIAMCLIWGIPYLLIKVAVSDISPVTLVFFRTVIGAVIIVPIALARGNVGPALRHWRWIALYTAVEVALPWFLVSDAELRLSSSLTALLIAATPFVGVLLGRLTGSDDRFDARRLFGLVVGFVGVAVLVGLNVSVRDLGAAGEIGLVAIGYALGPLIISRKLADAPPIGVVAMSLVLPAIVYAPLGLSHLPAAIPSPQVLLAIGLLGVVCTALAFLLFFALIADVGPVRATVITYVNPAVALALGVALLGEPLTIGAIAGFALILAGLFLATRRAKRGVPVHERAEEPLVEAR